MKTVLPPDIMTRYEAETFLKQLHDNGESFHPEDNAHLIAWACEEPSHEECDQLNKLMADIYAIPSFDPCEYLITLNQPKPFREFKAALNDFVNAAIKLNEKWPDETGDMYSNTIRDLYPFGMGFGEIVTQVIEWQKSLG